MGVTAENIVKEWGLTREELDEFSLNSQLKAEKAIKEGKFKDEIVPVMVPQRKGEPKVLILMRTKIWFNYGRFSKIKAMFH